MQSPATSHNAPARSASASQAGASVLAKVLAVSDNAADLQQVLAQIGSEGIETRGSSDATHAVRDFESFLPHVVVLAFDQMQKADRYLLALYRQSLVATNHAHRIVLLCAQGEAKAAAELCKKGCYDDYVLYWPMAQDGHRLTLSVWKAAQDAIAQASRPSAGQIAGYAGQMREVAELLQQESSEGMRVADTMTGALAGAEASVGAAIDDFRDRMTRPERDHAVVADGATFGREIDRLKGHAVRGAFADTAKAVAAGKAWPNAARQRLATMATQVRATASSLSPRRGTLMIVDDDPVHREIAAAALGGSGFRLVMLPDGASLVGAIRRDRPDMILMDIHLPDVDGLSLTKMIKGLPRFANVPVVMFTGHASRESIAKSVEAGAVGYILKPFTRETLLSQIERFVS